MPEPALSIGSGPLPRSRRAAPETIAAIFSEDADLVVGDGTHLRGRSEIAAYFPRMIAGADVFGTSIEGTRVTSEIQSVRFLDDHVALLLTQGGILFAGESEVPPERRGIQTTVLVEQNGAWLAAA